MIRKHVFPAIALPTAVIALLSIAGCWSTITSERAASAGIDLVPIEGGQVSGVPGTSAEVRVFKGIPYAAPPIGDLRWRAPQPVPGWSGVLKADKFGPACVQEQRVRDSLYWKGDEPQSEDCLYLNVWTKAKSAAEKLPVMVWIYGGAFTQGSSSGNYYPGENLARKGVVVVSMNYRLGIFGFFAHPGLTKESGYNASGNYALLDQNAALKWVRKNIAAFGGNPNNVLIFGQSAGAGSVASQMASPLSKGLFHRAIGMSGGFGGGQGALKLADAEQAGLKVAESMGAKSLSELRARTTDEIRRVQGSFRPVVDGYFFPEDTASIFAAGKQNDFPVIVGSTANEGGTNMRPLGTKDFVEQARRTYGEKADEYLKLYPAGSDDEAHASFYAAARDRSALTARTWAKLVTKKANKAFLYRFTQVPAFPPGVRFMEGDSSRFGAYHGADVPYVGNNLQALSWPWTEKHLNLADRMSSYWSNFAKTGDPNGPGLLTWTPYDDSNQQIMIFGNKVEMVPLPNKAGLDFVEAFQASRPAGTSRPR